MGYPSAIARNLPGKQHLSLTDFSGGLNLLSAPSELADNETGDCMNVTLDNGGVVKRLGTVRRNAGALPGNPQNIYYWPSKRITVFQIGATLYKTTDDFATWSSFATFTTQDPAGLTDFAGKLVAAHPADGVFTYDGTTWTLATASVKGSAIASWQNKVWVADTFLPRVWWSNAGNPTVFTIATDFNDLREKDDALIVALGIGQGMDVAGRPGLLAFKQESTYRINSSSTGSYTTIDSAVGAAGARAVATLAGVTAVINRNGIYTVDPAGANELQLVSGKLQPLFLPEQIAFGQQALFAAGVYRDRFVFSLPKVGQAANSMTLEYNPTVGWIVPHDFGVAAFATYGKDTHKLYGASPASAYVLELFKGGNDAGAAITARFMTRWFLPSDGLLNSFTRVRVSGRGACSLFTLLDYTLGEGELNDAELIGEQFFWNAANWNEKLWGPLELEGVADFYQLGFARAIAFRVTHTGTETSAGAAVLDGAAPEVGAFALYGLLLDFVVSGNA